MVCVEDGPEPSRVALVMAATPSQHENYNQRHNGRSTFCIISSVCLYVCVYVCLEFSQKHKKIKLICPHTFVNS